MDRLWAPWRLSYVAGAKPPEGQEPCFLCRGLAELNRYPYNNGHLLVAPNAHKPRLQDLNSEEHLEIQTTLAELIDLYDRLLHPEGYNAGLNLGRVAGAGLPGHLHWHLVPRWNGDTNFMPVLNDTRVIVQSLDSLYELLAEAWKP